MRSSAKARSSSATGTIRLRITVMVRIVAGGTASPKASNSAASSPARERAPS
ncbi:hypothetical protein [Streptomyces sp. W1SF4]|uniref:hypothetical protein n=1 Tax=Streptomyces sp. W1SF4 TaxID=2305220 RepID=UPI0013E00B6C|nr:hypothetical protein [Streptomyces sp. W1SF4]